MHKCVICEKEYEFLIPDDLFNQIGIEVCEACAELVLKQEELLLA